MSENEPKKMTKTEMIRLGVAALIAVEAIALIVMNSDKRPLWIAPYVTLELPLIVLLLVMVLIGFLIGVLVIFRKHTRKSNEPEDNTTQNK